MAQAPDLKERRRCVKVAVVVAPAPDLKERRKRVPQFAASAGACAGPRTGTVRPTHPVVIVDDKIARDDHRQRDNVRCVPGAPCIRLAVPAVNCPVIICLATGRGGGE